MLYIYDALWILIFTATGFMFHETLTLESFGRFLITYVPTLVFWYVGSLITGLGKKRFSFFDIILVSLVAGAWGTIIRNHLLGKQFVPVFAEIFTGMLVVFAILFRVLLLLGR